MVKVFSNVQAPVGPETGRFPKASTCEKQPGQFGRDRTSGFAEDHGVNGFRVRCQEFRIEQLDEPVTCPWSTLILVFEQTGHDSIWNLAP